MIFRQYNPRDVQCVWAGILMAGFAEGSKVNVKMAEDDYEMVSGTDGDTVLIRKNKPNGMITVRLQAESPINDLLTSRALVSRKSRIAVVSPAMVKILNGTSRFNAAYACLQGIPEVDYSDGAGVREWVILCADLEMYVGGAIF